MYESRATYHRPMKEFLNQYMGSRSDVAEAEADRLADVFRNTADVVLETLGKEAFRLRTAVNAAVLDSVMVGVAVRLEGRANRRGSGDERCLCLASGQ